MTMELTIPGDFSLLSVRGADARRFLQGQLSCDMNELSMQHSLPGAYCNLKGRVIADFVVCDTGDRLLLRCAPAMAARLQEALSRYAVFFKVELQDTSPIWRRYGLIGEAALQHFSEQFQNPPPELPWETVSTGGMLAIRLPGTTPRLEILSPAENDLPPHAIVNEAAAWQLEDIRSGIVHVGAARSEQYTPQVLNYDLNGTINFRKGCYTGQEIVARMHYRGKARRRLYHLVANAQEDDAADPTSTWQVISRDPDSASKGEVMEQQSTGTGVELLAILPDSLAEAAPETLYLSRQDGNPEQAASIRDIHRFD
ncbi:MAG: YgfZ/GcvT domain-containing protein [Pseudomonadota bacterium]